MHEGVAAPSYSIRRAGFAGSRLEALWASKSASPTATAKSEILTPRRWSGPSGHFLYHFSSRPGPRFTCPGFRPCGALRRCPRAFSRVNAASDRPSPKVTKGGRALARLATANFQFAERTRRRAKPFDGRQKKMMQLGKMKILNVHCKCNRRKKEKRDTRERKPL